MINSLNRFAHYVLILLLVAFALATHAQLGGFYVVVLLSIALGFYWFQHPLLQGKTVEPEIEARSVCILPEQETSTAEPTVSLDAQPKGQPKEKYATSALDERLSNMIYQELDKKMLTERWYLEPDLKLADLAEKMDISVNQLSQVINQSGPGNFFHFLNHYRIHFVCDKFSNPKTAHVALLDVAYEAGFNSKSTFYKAFKNIHQCSPAQYRKAMAA